MFCSVFWRSFRNPSLKGKGSVGRLFCSDESSSKNGGNIRDEWGGLLRAKNPHDLRKALGPFLDRPRDIPFALSTLPSLKSISDEETEMKFSCTNCGKCCREISSNVQLDPHDIFSLVSVLSFGSNERITTTELHQKHKEALRFEMAVFCEPTWKKSLGEVIGNSYGKFGPACFLNPQKPSSLLSSISPSSSSDTPPRCYFAIELEEESKGKKRKLFCSLGKEGMPYMCASYPLGDFVHTFPNGERENSGHQFFLLTDQEDCEGVGIGGARTVGDYRELNDLEKKRREREWFNRLATKFAAHSVVQRMEDIEKNIHASSSENNTPPQPPPPSLDLSTFRNEKNHFLDFLFGICQKLWYDYDSLPCKEEKGAPWESVKEMIERKTVCLSDAAQQHTNRLESNVFQHSPSFEQFVDDLHKEQLL